MTGKIRNMGTVARELAANRRARIKAEDTFAIYSVKKDGGLYARPHSFTFRTEAEALRHADLMRQWNPGSEFVVKAL